MEKSKFETTKKVSKKIVFPADNSGEESAIRT